MKKVLKDAKTLLLENMVKLNPDFKLTEAEDKWIQNAVEPSHKGYCTPMSKPTCTPKRKALARRFKKGIDEELGGINRNDYNIKVERLKAVLDDLLKNQEYEVLDTLYRLMVERKKQVTPMPMAEALGESPTYFNEDVQTYNKKADSIKAKLDLLVNDKHFDVIDKIDTILQKIPLKSTEVSEMARPEQNDTYFETLSEALDAVRTRVKNKGFEVDEDAMFTQFGTGGIGYGETKRANIPLLKNGIPDKRRSVTIAIYRMDSGKYELTAYLN